MKTLQKGKVTASAWMDNKVVSVLSTNTQPSAKGSVVRKQKDGTRISVPCPEAIIVYNSHMGGVDRGDQLRGYYNCRTRSRKFYKYIFYFLFDVSITNAFILYKHYHATVKYKNLKRFRLQLATELIGDYCSRRRSGCGGGGIHLLPFQHFPLKVDGESQTSRKRGRCADCTQSNHRSDTSWSCKECDVWLSPLATESQIFHAHTHTHTVHRPTHPTIAR